MMPEEMKNENEPVEQRNEEPVQQNDSAGADNKVSIHEIS